MHTTYGPSVLPSGDLLLTSAVARYLGVSAETIRVWARSGRLPAVTLERGIRVFAKADVERLAAMRQGAAPHQPEAA